MRDSAFSKFFIDAKSELVDTLTMKERILNTPHAPPLYRPAFARPVLATHAARTAEVPPVASILQRILEFTALVPRARSWITFDGRRRMAATISTSGVYSLHCRVYNARLFCHSSVLRRGDFSGDEISLIKSDNRGGWNKTRQPVFRSVFSARVRLIAWAYAGTRRKLAAAWTRGNKVIREYNCIIPININAVFTEATQNRMTIVKFSELHDHARTHAR